MKIKKSLRIGPHKIKVRFDGPWLDEDSCGNFILDLLQISIASNLPPSLTIETYLHEIIEAINAIYELKMKHSSIQTMGVALLQVLPQLGLAHPAQRKSRGKKTKGQVK